MGFHPGVSVCVGPDRGGGLGSFPPGLLDLEKGNLLLGSL